MFQVYIFPLFHVYIFTIFHVILMLTGYLSRKVDKKSFYLD